MRLKPHPWRSLYPIPICVIEYHRHISTGNHCNSALLANLGFCGIVLAFKGLEISFTKKHQFIKGAMPKHECQGKKEMR